MRYEELVLLSDQRQALADVQLIRSETLTALIERVEPVELLIQDERIQGLSRCPSN